MLFSVRDEDRPRGSTWKEVRCPACGWKTQRSPFGPVKMRRQRATPPDPLTLFGRCKCGAALVPCKPRESQKKEPTGWEDRLLDELFPKTGEGAEP